MKQKKLLLRTMNWQDLQFFISIAKAGGLAGAEKNTGKSAATLGRRMLALERSTGRELFHRHSHGYELTENGSELLDIATGMARLISRFDNASVNASRLLIKVSAGTWMTQVLCNNLHEIVGDNEHIRIRFISSEQRLDISHREATIGIRNHRPEDPSLAVRKIGKVRFAGYAVDETITQWVQVSGSTPSSQWLKNQAFSTAAVEVSSPSNALDLALAGAGRVVLPTFVGDLNPKLIKVTPIINALSHDQWLVVHQDDRHQRDVRYVIDRIFNVAKSLHT